MSATNYTPIQLYRTTTASATPSAGNLADGELAINLTDEKLYFKNAGGTVKLLAANLTPVGNGGTGTTTQFTTGSVVFAGVSGVYSQDNANLFWDDANNRLGVGTSSPGATLHVVGTVNFTGALTSGDLANAVGYKGLPQNSQTAAYTLALSDMGKHISITTGGVVIPANSSVAFPVGSAISIYNNSGSNQTISITTDTLRQAGTANTGSRTIAGYGIATVVKVASTTWVISGAGLS